MAQKPLVALVGRPNVGKKHTIQQACWSETSSG